ncbi:MAG: BatA and WFA domain-containing protein [Phycisphaerae bacterium]
MSFLSPWWIAAAAGLTVPPLIALYFLKLKRAKHAVPSTLLWRRTVEDFHVNSPFQRLRRNLLLLLQLLVLIAGALALGRPMFQNVETHDSTVIVMIDQSASMGVIEEDGRSRLDLAKEQAKRCVDNMSDDARAMVIAFSDRATVVSSFDADKAALKRKIDSIELTESTTTLGEAMSLAEAYTQNIIIGGETAGTDIAPERPDVFATPASVFLFTDGRIADAELVSLQTFDVSAMMVTSVGTRGDNVGIVAMDARRRYEQPDVLQITATVRNFGPAPVSVDAVLYVDGENREIVTFDLGAAPGQRGGPRDATRDTGGTQDAADGDAGAEDAAGVGAGPSPPAGDGLGAPAVRVVPFTEVFAGGGVIEVVLRTDDALAADNHAWTIAEAPRHLRVLLVTPGNMFLENVLSTLSLTFDTMTGAVYEAADDDDLVDGDRSAYDVVIFDGHSTERLPQGNYLFWGAIPKIDGVSAGGKVEDEVIFNWDDTHPILRYVAPEAINVYEWTRLKLPPEAVSIMDGQTSPVMSFLSRDARQYLICAFKLIVEDEFGRPSMNTFWVTQVDFVVFMQNAIQFLASNIAATGERSVAPGQPVTLPIPKGVEQVTIRHPDNATDPVPSAGFQNIHYARTRDVGVYHVEPGVPGADAFVVNLFNAVESDVSPANTLTIGAESVRASQSTVRVRRPAWQYFLAGVLALLLIEWIVYNKRIFI